MKLGKKPWELDWRLKCKIHEANMNLTGGQHRVVRGFAPATPKGCTITKEDYD